MSRATLITCASTLLVSACTTVMTSGGGGEVETPVQPPSPDGRAVALPDGYRAEVVATGLTFPTQIAFDDSGTAHVTESGYSYGEVFRPARLLRLDNGNRRTVVAESSNGPWTGVAFHGGAFYVAEGGVLDGGRILRITPDGNVTALIEDLPSRGDHHTNGPAVGPDGSVYFSVGTATNSGVVGPDNAEFGWLRRFEDFHDTPCRDVVLAGENFSSDNPLSPDESATTGAFVPFGTRTERGQVIPGAVPCNGAVMRLPPEGGPVELVAWGFRNPFGLAFAPDGQLYVTDNGYDDRGSRPVLASGDWLWRVERDRWYGWPDFAGGVPVWHMEGGPPRVMAIHPNEAPRPTALFGVHSSSNHLDFSHSDEFGFAGQAFVAQFGDQAPVVGRVREPVGFRVVRVDVERGVVTTFAVNRRGAGPASKVGGNGLERPIAARFDPSGRALYVVDFGVMTMDGGSNPMPDTGVIWRITREGNDR